jgi:AcrR family transcriptional regulator
MNFIHLLTWDMARISDPNLKQGILVAARETFREKGYADARMSDIAARAGVAVGSIYLHFKTKESLVVAISDEINREVVAWLEPCLKLPDAVDAMEAAVRAGLDFYHKERDFIQLLYLGMGLRGMAETWQDADDPMMRVLADFLRERMATGQIRRYDPDKLAVLIFGMVDQAAMHTILFGAGDIKDYTPTLVQMVRNVLAPEVKPVRKPASRRAGKQSAHAKRK